MKWFKMDCDAQDNLDMKKLVDDWGWEWYGRYYAILGKVGMLVNDKCQTFALQTNNGCPFPVKLLANELSTTVERLTNFLDYLSDNHLIDPTAWKDKNLIYCPKLRERADEYTQKLIGSRDKVPTKSRQCREQEVEEEVEVDKKKNNIYDFDAVWKDYPKRIGRKEAAKHFRASVKTDKDFQDISVALKNYKDSEQVRGGFIQNGSTWFNNWQDWIDPPPIVPKMKQVYQAPMIDLTRRP